MPSIFSGAFFLRTTAPHTYVSVRWGLRPPIRVFSRLVLGARAPDQKYSRGISNTRVPSDVEPPMTQETEQIIACVLVVASMPASIVATLAWGQWRERVKRRKHDARYATDEAYAREYDLETRSREINVRIEQRSRDAHCACKHDAR